LLAVLSAACKDRRLLNEGSSTTAKSSSKTTATAAPATAVTRPATTVTTTVLQPGSDYTVEPGDTISGIAKKTGVTVAAILAANNLTDPNRITAGQTLRIPAPTGATTAPGAQPTSATQPPPVATAKPATTLPPGTQTSIVTITVVVTIPPTTKP
jgi:peptidoglycan DL-endopeptidase LytF